MRPAPDAGAAHLPPGQRLYAIGDIHGRRDLLDRLLAAIARDAAEAPPAERTILFLGDYIDRGPDSADVIERLVQPIEGFRKIALLGNHEALMLRFLEDVDGADLWLTNGGNATLASYDLSWSGDWPDLQRRLRMALPAAHRRFLETLLPCHRAGDYFFAHAGIRPGVALDRQRREDLIWIRDRFLDSPADHGAVVVHGHSIRPEPEVRANRIGIDTGAFMSGRLTALCLDGAERRFLAT